MTPPTVTVDVWRVVLSGVPLLVLLVGLLRLGWSGARAGLANSPERWRV